MSFFPYAVKGKPKPRNWKPTLCFHKFQETVFKKDEMLDSFQAYLKQVSL